jgi:hypothetical protein
MLFESRKVWYNKTNVHRPLDYDMHWEVIKVQSFSSPVIENFIWIEPLLRGHLSYQATFSLSKRWSLNTGLSVCSLLYFLHYEKTD